MSEGVAAEPIVSRLNVVFLYVRDLERSLAFYRDLLGIPLERDAHDPGWAEATFADGVRFALPAAAQPDAVRAGTVVVDFEVADIDEAVARVRAAGVEMGEVERDSWGCACGLRDPDGYRLHLFQPATGAAG